jgi:hypothetical protein
MQEELALSYGHFVSVLGAPLRLSLAQEPERHERLDNGVVGVIGEVERESGEVVR